MLLCGLMTVLAISAINLPNVTEKPKDGCFPLVTADDVATICTDARDYSVVGITAEMLADDVERVTGRRPMVCHELPKKAAVVAGTLGKSRLINQVVKSQKIDVSGIRGKWESFVITTTEHPRYHTPLLVIIGSDRRGTAFGLTALSEAIGVSPWYWWADISCLPAAAWCAPPVWTALVPWQMQNECNRCSVNSTSGHAITMKTFNRGNGVSSSTGSPITGSVQRKLTHP